MYHGTCRYARISLHPRRRIRLLGFVVRRHYSDTEEYLDPVDTEVWKSYFYFETLTNFNRYSRPRIIADASTSENKHILEK